MQKLILSIALILTLTVCFAQEEQELSKKVAAEFDTLYNAKNFENIFSKFSPEMKAALPHDQAINFFTSLYAQAGKISQREFINYKQGLVALYKAQFEKAVFALYLSADQNEKINGILIKPYVNESLPVLERNTSQLILPFKGEWTVIWGGDTEELNYHVTTPSQKGAFDLVITDKNGSSHKGTGRANEDYYAFGKELFAPVAGEVVAVVDGIPDNQPGTMNPAQVTGNTVIIKTENNEYYLLAHFKLYSIRVKQGDQIAKGQLLGQCGNSGNSSEPHLHFHLQNTIDMKEAMGAKCYFQEIRANGEIKKDYSPIKGERIANL